MKPRSFPSSCDRSCAKMAALYIKSKYGDRICGAITRLSQDILICQFLANQATCKRTQHCWPTTPNIFGCYMLRLFAHPLPFCCVLLGVVAQILKPVKLLATSKRTQKLPTMLGVVGQQCCVCLHGALVDFLFYSIVIWKWHLLLTCLRKSRELSKSFMYYVG